MQTTEARTINADVPQGVDVNLLERTLEATERRLSEGGILHVFSNIDAYWKMAKLVAAGGVTHHRKPEALVTIAVAAFEMNIPFTVAMRGMYLVDGKLAMETWLMDMLATRLGVTKTIHKATLFECELTLHHADRPDIDSAFTLEDAKRARIIKDYDPETFDVTVMRGASGKPRGVWDRHPEELLYWRALAKGLRRIAPDLFGGVYTPDETEAFDPRRSHGPTKADANDALDALVHGVEPDPDVMTDDEIVRASDDLDQARKDEIIDAELANEIKADMEHGRWSDARVKLESVREEMLAEAQRQGQLL